MLSPIAQLIDRVCDLSRAIDPRPSVTLRCSKCGRTKQADLDLTDPPCTAVVQCLCPSCDRGDGCEILYFDSNNRQIHMV